MRRSDGSRPAFAYPAFAEVIRSALSQSKTRAAVTTFRRNFGDCAGGTKTSYSRWRTYRSEGSGDGIDCRYCHTSVEVSAQAGMPPTETCMTCHSQIWTRAKVLAPVRQSFATGKPLRWTRVYRLPAYVFFNHSIHIAFWHETLH